MAFESSLLGWSASSPVTVECVLREDRQGFDFIARVPHGIPKHEWALLLGDALHNFRSAFDALAWGLAHFGDAHLAKPKSVYFPICTDRHQWDIALKACVREINPELRDRLRALQPFTYTHLGAPSILQLIHDLDIQDKHKDFLTVSASMNGLAIDAGSFKYENPDTEPALRLEMHPDVKLADGAVLGTLHAGATIGMLGQMFLRPAIQVNLTWEGQTFDVESILRQVTVETRRYLDILMHGYTQDDPDKDEWSSIGVTAP